MVAAEKRITETLKEEAQLCPECLGTGMLSGWSEIAYFEERRPCGRCDAGRRADSRIAEIVRRAQLEERIA
jgi:ribosomal protein S27AE